MLNDFMSISTLITAAAFMLPLEQDIKKPRPSTRTDSGGLPSHVISAIRFEGDGPRPGENIKKKLLSRVGQPLDRHHVEADARLLMRTKWYSSVNVYYEESPRKSGKLILTFDVRSFKK